MIYIDAFGFACRLLARKNPQWVKNRNACKLSAFYIYMFDIIKYKYTIKTYESECLSIVNDYNLYKFNLFTGTYNDNGILIESNSYKEIIEYIKQNNIDV